MVLTKQTAAKRIAANDDAVQLRLLSQFVRHSLTLVHLMLPLSAPKRSSGPDNASQVGNYAF